MVAPVRRALVVTICLGAVASSGSRSALCSDLRTKTPDGIMCSNGTPHSSAALICPSSCASSQCVPCSLPLCNSSVASSSLCCCGAASGAASDCREGLLHEHDCVCTSGRAAAAAGGGGLCLGSGLTCHWCGLPPPPPPPPRRLRVGLYVAPYIGQPGVFTTNDTTLPQYLAETVGVTDVFLPYVSGAFAVDNNTRMLSPADAEPTVMRYRSAGISTWMEERPAPAAEWVEHPPDVLWNTSVASDALWAQIVVRAVQSYSLAKSAGFAGLVYDAEDYYGGGKMWGDEANYGETGQYYRRGVQLGLVIQNVWANVTVIQIYGVST